MSYFSSNNVFIFLLVQIVFFLSIFTFAHVALAESVVRHSDSVSISVDQVVESDAYLFGNSVTVSGKIDGDVLSGAASVTQNGSVAGDVLAAAARVHIYGPVGDDVRIIAGDVEIADAIEGDIFVVAGSLKILSTATISGDVFFFGHSATLEGTVKGSVHGSYNDLRIDGVVEGDVDAKVANKITLGSKASVVGNVQYVSENNIVRAADANVGGSVIKEGSSESRSASENNYRQSLIAFLISLFSALTLYVLARQRLTPFVVKSCQPFLSRFIVGFLVMTMLPVLSLLLIITVLGFWLGLGLLAVWLLLLVAAYVTTPILLGSILWKIIGGSYVINTLTICIGATVLFLTLQVPVVGILLVFFFMGILIGGFSIASYRQLR